MKALIFVLALTLSLFGLTGAALADQVGFITVVNPKYHCTARVKGKTQKFTLGGKISDVKGVCLGDACKWRKKPNLRRWKRSFRKQRVTTRLTFNQGL